MKHKVETYLISTFPEKKILKEGEFQYKKNSQISRIEIIDLKNCYDKFEFYKTQLQTAYFEFPNVEVLIAVETTTPKNIHLLKSLSFEAPDPEFLKLFYGCIMYPANKRHRLAYAITTLLASIAVQPQIEELSSDNISEIKYRINQANHSYVEFNYKFNAKGELEYIFSISN